MEVYVIFLCLCMCVVLFLQPGIMMLRDRLFHAQGEATVGQQPQRPNNTVNASTAKPTPAAQTPAQKSQIMVFIP